MPFKDPDRKKEHARLRRAMLKAGEGASTAQATDGVEFTGRTLTLVQRELGFDPDGFATWLGLPRFMLDRLEARQGDPLPTYLQARIRPWVKIPCRCGHRA